MTRPNADDLLHRIALLKEQLVPEHVVIMPEWRLANAEQKLFRHLATRDLATKESCYAALYGYRPETEASRRTWSRST